MIERALAKDPAERQNSAAGLMRALDGAFPEDQRTGGLAPRRRARRPGRLAAAAAVVAAVLGAAALGALVSNATEPAPSGPEGPERVRNGDLALRYPSDWKPTRPAPKIEGLTLADPVAVAPRESDLDDGELVAGRIASGRLPPQASAQVVDLRGVLGRALPGAVRARLAPEGGGLRHPGRGWRSGDRGLCRSHGGDLRLALPARGLHGPCPPGGTAPGRGQPGVRPIAGGGGPARGPRPCQGPAPAGPRAHARRSAPDHRARGPGLPPAGRGAWPGSKLPRRPARATGGPSPSCAGRPAATPGWRAPPAPAGADAGSPHGTACGGPKANSRAPSAGSGGRDTTCGSHI